MASNAIEENDYDEVRIGKRSGDWTTKTSKTNSNLRKDFINYFSAPPSLQYIATVSTAIGLWTEPDIKKEMISSLYDDTKISELEKRVLNRLSNSSLPTLLKAEISYVIRPVESQLLKVFRDCSRWINQKDLFEYYMECGTVYWTVEGTTDVVKSLKELFSNESLGGDVCRLYKIACSYCLGEFASVLWEKIPAQIKSKIRTAILGDMYESHIILYWTSVLENNLGHLLTKIKRIDYENIYSYNLGIDVNMITCSIRVLNIAALKYFWKKVSDQEKNDNLSKWLELAIRRMETEAKHMRFKHHPTYQESTETLDVLCFLLSQVSGTTEMTDFFQNHSHVLVLLFENWPYQRIFLPTVLELLNDLQEDVYLSIMNSIISHLNETGNEVIIFKEIWSASPPRLRLCFLKNKIICSNVLFRLLELGNLSMALMLLKHAPREEIKPIIRLMLECHGVVIENPSDLNSFHALLSESTLPPECYPYKINRSEQDKGIFKLLIRFKKWHICNQWIYDGNTQAAEAFLRWAFQSMDEIHHFKKTKLLPCDIYFTLIFCSNYERVDQFLNWYFETSEEIQQFKGNFMRENDNYNFKRLLDNLFNVPKTASDALQKFINYNFSSLDDIAEFQFICRNWAEYALSRGNPECATVLLNASFNSTDDVKR